MCSRSQHFVTTQTKAMSRLNIRLMKNEPLIEWAGDERWAASEREGCNNVENGDINKGGAERRIYDESPCTSQSSCFVWGTLSG